MDETNCVKVVDLNNLVMSNGKPRLEKFFRLRKKLEEFAKDVIYVASSSLKYRIDDKERYLKFVKEGVILESPHGVDTDLFILQIAREFDASILSNDAFREYKPRYADEINRCLRFMIVKDKIIIPSLN